jgi:hypothetical protein
VNALLALALLVQAPATDTLQVREGLYVAVAVGPAVTGLSCNECGSSSGTQVSGLLNAGVGVAVSPHLTAGIQLEGWSPAEGEGGIGAWSMVMTWYPSRASGAFIRPSLGLASFTGMEVTDGPEEEGDGMMVGLTLGHDLRFDRKLSLTPSLTVRYADIGNTHQVTFPMRSDLTAWMVGLGVGLTWH